MISVHETNRNITVDVIRGIAMLFVIMGHTLSGITSDYQESFFYNIIWTLQMPLFMIISGYVTKFSKAICDKKTFCMFIKKRTISYLVPLLVWTIIRGVIFQSKQFLDPVYLLWHMDSGYWFLSSLWTICMFFGISNFLASVISKNNKTIVRIALTLLFMICGSGLLASIGLAVGWGFFGIKLSLYYTPFFAIGYVFGALADKEKARCIVVIRDIVIMVATAIYFFLIVRNNFALVGDGIKDTILRFTASLVGCIMFFGWGSKFISSIGSNNCICRSLLWIGVHSLDIYLVHYLLLCPIKTTNNPSVYSVQGIEIFVVNFFITVIFTCLIASVINHNKIARIILLGKLK